MENGRSASRKMFLHMLHTLFGWRARAGRSGMMTRALQMLSTRKLTAPKNE